MGAEAWSRVAADRMCPDLTWLAPHVFYIGKKV